MDLHLNKSLLNVQQIYDFVQQQEFEKSQSKEGADSEAMVIHDKTAVDRYNQLNEKQKWKRVMQFMRNNPKTLVDALPEPASLNKTMYHPIYDEIIDQENNFKTANITNSQDIQEYSNYDQDALTLNTQNRDSLDANSQAANIKIVQNQPIRVDSSN